MSYNSQPAEKMNDGEHPGTLDAITNGIVNQTAILIWRTGCILAYASVRKVSNATILSFNEEF